MVWRLECNNWAKLLCPERYLSLCSLLPHRKVDIKFYFSYAHKKKKVIFFKLFLPELLKKQES